MAAKYIIRLDDASEYMDYNKWDPYFELFDKYRLNPIIAVIPFNKDPEMTGEAPDGRFWERVRSWQEKGYRIAMHGYQHLYANRNSGIIGLNKYSEFAGVPLSRQIEMLAEAGHKFKTENIKTEIFVAPAHSFDKNTLTALKQVTDIKCISDGFFLNPVRKNGLNWIPQQLWIPEEKPGGVWTICYHPETLSGSDVSLLDSFLSVHSHQFVDPLSLVFGKLKPGDVIFAYRMKTDIMLHRLFNPVIRLLKSLMKR
jgi:hypothetical protein